MKADEPRHNGPGRRVLFRCDGDAQIGLGHVMRCLALAEEMRDTHECEIVFAVERGEVGVELIQRANYIVERSDGNHEGIWLDNLILRLKPDALILDVRSELSRHQVQYWREAGVVTVTIDDASERRLACDLAFYPPVPQVQQLGWMGYTGSLHCGWNWAVLRREFAEQTKRLANERPVVLVTMGGSDPYGLTLRAIVALDTLREKFETIVVLGPGFAHEAELQNLLKAARRRFELRRDVSGMAELMAGVDMAVASFGVTAYELAASGVPAIYLCLTPDHAQSASAFVEAGITMNAGVHQEVAPAHLAGLTRALLGNNELRETMSHRARQLVDGLGTQRIAANILKEMKSKHDAKSPLASA